MKKVFLLFLFSCNTNNHINSNSEQINQIDSISNYMDLKVFKIINSPIEENRNVVWEDFNSYATYYRKDFPQFAKYAVRNHDSLFIDSIFYFYNDHLIKFIAKKTRDHKAFDSIALYFNRQILVGSNVEIDSIIIKPILKIADIHLNEVKKRNTR